MLATGVVVALGAFRFGATRHLTFTVGEPPAEGKLGELLLASRDDALPIRFSEGTMVLLRPGARGRVTRVGDKGGEVILESGRARIEVTPRAQADWRVRTGPFEIFVKGTRFETGYDPRSEDFWLELEEGRVTVTGCGLDARPVAPGERLTASCALRELPSTLSRADSEGHSPVDGAMGASDSTAERGRRASASEAPGSAAREARVAGAVGHENARSRSWVELAREGRFEDAYEIVREDFQAECLRRGAAELWLLGDVARLSGHAGMARRAYLAVRDRFPRAPESADAAFALGRLALQSEGDRASAQRWFEVHLRERPDGPLAPAALGRLMEIRLELADRPGATAIAREYLQRYPAGPYAAGARRLLGSHDQEHL
jgi:hypothetical protein